MVKFCYVECHLVRVSCMLSIINYLFMLSVAMLSVVMLCFFMLRVVAPAAKLTNVLRYSRNWFIARVLVVSPKNQLEKRKLTKLRKK